MGVFAWLNYAKVEGNSGDKRVGSRDTADPPRNISLVSTVCSPILHWAYCRSFCEAFVEFSGVAS